MFLKRLSPRPLFSLTPSSLLSRYAQCSTSPSHHTYPHSHSHPDPRNVRVSVWWDLDNCNLPSGVNVFRGAQAITAAIESSGIKGPIEITALGDMLRLARQEALCSTSSTASTAINSTDSPPVDMLRLARTNQDALSSTTFTAMNFTDIPPGEDTASILSSTLQFWVFDNPPPAHLFLITFDVHNACLLHRLRMANYNILLATKDSDTGRLRSAATIMWNWDALVRGENLTGRYFNQPPNGSWYGHYEVPLEEIENEIEDEVLQQKPHEVFSHDSFWTDLKTFIHSDIGSLIIAQSRNRKNMAYYLRKYGPSVLKSLTKSDVLLMVDKLISEKCWVMEDGGFVRPFQLTSSYSVGKFSNSDDEFSEDEFSG